MTGISVSAELIIAGGLLACGLALSCPSVLRSRILPRPPAPVLLAGPGRSRARG